MNDLISKATSVQKFFLDKIKLLDFTAPLLLRLYLVPIFWMAGTKKWADMESTAAWFGNPDWGLGLPMPEVLAYMATLTEIFGAVFLLVGFAVRWISIPLMFTMIVAAVSVHLQNGWLAIAEGSGPFATERTIGAIERLDRAKSILQDNANYSWLTENGSLVILNNGIEFATTYFIMLLALLFTGSGKASIDHVLYRYFMSKD
ncbi:MAG TPA: DoxX family protein [Gammaproteobacteria bacterium]|nr:DoxX family protein [Gammaproteobacteria bacterium]